MSGLSREHPHRRSRWWILGNAFLVYFVAGGFVWTYIAMVAPEVQADLGIELADWGMLWSGIALGVLALSIPAGALGDRFGTRRTVGAGLAICGAALLVRAAAGGFSTMFLSMVLLGCGYAFVFTIVPKTIGSWFPPEQLGMAMGFSFAGLGLGQGVAALTTSRIVARLGSWRELTEVLGYITIALALYWVLAVRDVSRPGQGTTPEQERTPPPMRRVLRLREVWLIALCYLFYLGGHLGAVSYLPTYFRTVQGMSPELTGFIIALGPWCFVVGSAIVPALSDRLGRRKIVFISAILVIGAAIFAQAFLTGLPLAAASAIWGICAGAASLIFVVPIESARIGPVLAGTAFGAITCFGFLGGAVFPAVGLALAEVRPIFALGFFSVCYLISASLFAALPETGRRVKAAP